MRAMPDALTRLMEGDMEHQRPSLYSWQTCQEFADDQFSSRPLGPILTSQQPSIETGVRAAVAAAAESGPDAEETLLLAAARMGHPTAFGDLVERHAGRIRRIAFRVTRNREDAEDVVQECFKNAFARFHSFRGQSRFSTWLARIATNCALMKIRARRGELVPLDDSIEALVSVKCRHVLRLSLTPEESYSRREVESILAEEMARLEPKLQAALHLFLMEGLMTRDAAKVLGISNSALKARVYRARLALRPRLNRRGIGRRPVPNDHQMGSSVLDQGGGTSAWFMAVRHCPDLGD